MSPLAGDPRIDMRPLAGDPRGEILEVGASLYKFRLPPFNIPTKY